MEKPRIPEEKLITRFESRFLNLYELNLSESFHYYIASRRKRENTVCLQSDEKAAEMPADAVTCFVIARGACGEEKLLLTREFRYPVGQTLYSLPAGLMDPTDLEQENPLFYAAAREIFEETGIRATEFKLVSPILFSSPGMTDESNALIAAYVDIDDASVCNADASEATEIIGDYRLVNREEALELLRRGRDENGIGFPVYTWCALMYFVGGGY